MLEWLTSNISDVQEWIEKVKDPAALPDAITTSHYFDHPLQRGDPLLLLAVFIVLILKLLGQVPRTTCNFALQMLKVLLDTALRQGTRSLSYREEQILDHFPRDIRGVQKAFDLEAVVIVYATCPSCCCTYVPSYQDDIPVYPSRCQHRSGPRSKPCNSQLMTTRVLDGESVRSPIRPFIVQDFHAFVGGLISRPGMEEILRQGKAIRDRYNLRDITNGSAVANMQGPDRKPFADAAEGELRLLWALSVDWFNPYLNKIAGLSISTGSMAMLCLYLPPSMRYKTDNLYLAGIIPGPKEPKLECTNHFLCPLVDQLLVSWERGIWYNRTYDYPRGRRVRSVLALIITDLPGSRKKQSINNIDMTTWKMKTAEEILEAAVRWRDADTQEERKHIFKEFGVRWSELNRLPYWDPVQRIVIDGMHNIFLGVTQFHSRKVIGMDVPIGDREDAGNSRKIKENNLISLRCLLLKDPEPRLLLHFRCYITITHKYRSFVKVSTSPLSTIPGAYSWNGWKLRGSTT
ncbi:hypothetical protein SCP_0312500 [Sparassis crispa]|uniref:Uncharacterized protein n=1 Tax=Sparassis crispa TaxID=139825 RepID=A0A401GHC2_9APHY|nr:hypothetical protein SCP_0312500 [Sparassis crispa]GBE81521.1 hypothetical protein SCP_0312500 [Sparassis crispa]